MLCGDFVCVQALEEIFKTQLNNITSNTKTISTPELGTVRYSQGQKERVTGDTKPCTLKQSLSTQSSLYLCLLKASVSVCLCLCLCLCLCVFCVCECMFVCVQIVCVCEHVCVCVHMHVRVCMNTCTSACSECYCKMLSAPTSCARWGIVKILCIVLILLIIFRPMIQENASKIWVTYAENERKSSFLQTEKLQNQIQSVSTVTEICLSFGVGNHFRCVKQHKMWSVLIKDS